MKFRLPKWLRRERQPSKETEELRERLAQVHRDDRKVDQVTKRTQRLMEVNHLARDIKKALGVQP